MFFAFAALLLHLGSGFSAVPAAAVPAAAPAPAPTADLPLAPLPSKPSLSTSTAAQPESTVSAVLPRAHESSLLRVASLDPGNANAQSLSTIRVPDPEPIKEEPRISVEGPGSRRKWLALAAISHGAATFDAYSTRQAIQAGAHEDDPFMRPFASSPGIYAAIQVAPAILDLTARHMQRSQVGLLRRTWWLPQSVGTGIFLFSGVHNLHVANTPQ
jgi:hypothetical protein